MPVNQRVLVQFHYNLVTTNRFTIDGWIYFQCNAGRNRTTVGWCDKWHCLDFIPVSVFAQVTHRMMNLPLYTRFAPILSVSAVAWKSHTQPRFARCWQIMTVQESRVIGPFRCCRHALPVNKHLSRRLKIAFKLATSCRQNTDSVEIVVVRDQF